MKHTKEDNIWCRNASLVPMINHSVDKEKTLMYMRRNQYSKHFCEVMNINMESLEHFAKFKQFYEYRLYNGVTQRILISEFEKKVIKC